MHLFGIVALGYMWGKMALAANTRLAEAPATPLSSENKLTTARFFMERLMPETALRRARVEAGAESTMALAAEAF